MQETALPPMPCVLLNKEPCWRWWWWWAEGGRIMLHLQAKRLRGLTETIFDLVNMLFFFFFHQGQEVAADRWCKEHQIWIQSSSFGQSLILASYCSCCLFYFLITSSIYLFGKTAILSSLHFPAVSRWEVKPSAEQLRPHCFTQRWCIGHRQRPL